MYAQPIRHEADRPRHSSMIVRSALLVFATVLTLMSVAGRAQTTLTLADIFEQAAYQQNTANNPERAIALYRQVINSEKATRQMTAQALYNTGLCYAKLKKSTDAAQAFGSVVTLYKDVEPYARLANAQLVQTYSPVTPRWRDGERLEYEVRSEKSEEVRNHWTLTSKVNFNGRAAWKMLSRSQGDGLSMVIADEKNLRPISSHASNPSIGQATATWTENSRVIHRAGQVQPTETRFEGAVYDSEQIFWMFRQVSMSVGTKVKAHFLGAILTDVVIPAEFEVAGEERIQVPAGQFDAYKLTTGNGLSTVWIAKGPERYLLKVANPTGSYQLKRISTAAPGTWRTVAASTTSLSISVPDEWFDASRKDERKHSGVKTINAVAQRTLVTVPREHIRVMDDEAKVKTQITITDTLPLQGYENFDLSLAGQNAEWILTVQKEQAGYAEREGSKVNRVVAGLPALSMIVDFQERKIDWVCYWTSVMRDSKFIWIGMFARKESFDEAKPTFDRMLSTISF